MNQIKKLSAHRRENGWNPCYAWISSLGTPQALCKGKFQFSLLKKNTLLRYIWNVLLSDHFHHTPWCAWDSFAICRLVESTASTKLPTGPARTFAADYQLTFLYINMSLCWWTWQGMHSSLARAQNIAQNCHLLWVMHYTV